MWDFSVLGYGRGVNNGDEAWDSKKQAAIDRCVKGGLRNFYHCGYTWSFLRPIITLTLANGTQIVALPEDCGGVEGQIAVSTTTGTQWQPIDFTGIGAIYNAYASFPDAKGRPSLCAQETIKGTTLVRGQRFQLHFWPVCEQDYTLRFQYYLNPDYLSGTMPYAYGGAQHAETLLESCLAVAEKVLDDAANIHEMEFAKRLAISQEIDGRHKPQWFGYNGDKSDVIYTEWRKKRLNWQNPVQFNGIAYP